MLTVFTWGEISFVPPCSDVGVFVIVVVQPLVLVFDVYFAGLFEHPAVSIGVVGCLVRGAMNLARALQYAVQTRRCRIVSFKWFFPLTGLGATESGIDCRVFGVVAVISTPMSIASWLSVAISGIRSAMISLCDVTAS